MTERSLQNPWLRAWGRFKGNRLGYRSLQLFLALTVLSLFAEVLSNDKPLLVRYSGHWYVPLVQTLTISRAIMTNRRMSDALEIVAQGIKRGEGVSTPLTRSGQFPLLLSHLIAVGEETGRLDAMFLRAADIYDADTRSAIKRFTSLFEPLIILFMGVVIGSLILSLMMAITSLNDVGM